jgi:hypothetical protein
MRCADEVSVFKKMKKRTEQKRLENYVNQPVENQNTGQSNSKGGE